MTEADSKVCLLLFLSVLTIWAIKHFFRGHKLFSELRYSKRSVLEKKCAQPNMTLQHIGTNFFFLKNNAALT